MSDAPPPPKPRTALITGACVTALVGVVFSLAHLFWPTPLLFALFMIVGQGSFGLALLLYGIAIVKDLKRKNVL
jgi:xanthosine utilization system XapX-like protein